MLKLILLVALLVPAAPAGAGEDPPRPLNTDGAGVALKGYDAVAYFTERTAVEGSPAIQYEWNGATWRFASAANRDRFAQDPAAYAPQFGGFCAWAVSRNYTADIDPTAFDVVNGKLYLNYSKIVQLRWKVHRDENIRRAEQNWPKLATAPKGTK
jgi:YHS domain-containing protein